MKRLRDHVPWKMAERVRSRHSNTDVAALDMGPYTRAQQRQHVENVSASTKESSRFQKGTTTKEHLSDIEESEDTAESAPRISQSKSKQNRSERKRSVESYLRTIQQLSWMGSN